MVGKSRSDSSSKDTSGSESGFLNGDRFETELRLIVVGKLLCLSRQLQHAK